MNDNKDLMYKLEIEKSKLRKFNIRNILFVVTGILILFLLFLAFYLGLEEPVISFIDDIMGW